MLSVTSAWIIRFPDQIGVGFTGIQQPVKQWLPPLLISGLIISKTGLQLVGGVNLIYPPVIGINSVRDS
jgi:hypothetical protein